jgi:hypothetical protein
METVREETVTAFNKFLVKQRQVPGEVTLSLVQFDDEYEVVYDAVPLENVPDLTQQRFVPRGRTALLDAMGKMVRQLDARLDAAPAEQRPRLILFVVLTDGYENASREFDQHAVFDLIKQRRERGWQFVYLGANQDAIATASRYGIDGGGSVNFAARRGGVDRAMSSLSSAVTRRRSRRSPSPAGPGETEDFFTEDERRQAGDSDDRGATW